MSNNNRAPVSASENFLEGGLIEINGEIVEDIAQILIHNLVAKDDIHLRPIIRETMKTVWMIAEMRRRNLHLFKKSEEGREVECESSFVKSDKEEFAKYIHKTLSSKYYSIKWQNEKPSLYVINNYGGENHVLSLDEQWNLWLHDRYAKGDALRSWAKGNAP